MRGVESFWNAQPGKHTSSHFTSTAHPCYPDATSPYQRHKAHAQSPNRHPAQHPPSLPAWHPRTGHSPGPRLPAQLRDSTRSSAPAGLWASRKGPGAAQRFCLRHGHLLSLTELHRRRSRHDRTLRLWNLGVLLRVSGRPDEALGIGVYNMNDAPQAPELHSAWLTPPNPKPTAPPQPHPGTKGMTALSTDTFSPTGTATANGPPTCCSPTARWSPAAVRTLPSYSSTTATSVPAWKKPRPSLPMWPEVDRAEAIPATAGPSHATLSPDAAPSTPGLHSVALRLHRDQGYRHRDHPRQSLDPTPAVGLCRRQDRRPRQQPGAAARGEHHLAGRVLAGQPGAPRPCPPPRPTSRRWPAAASVVG